MVRIVTHSSCSSKSHDKLLVFFYALVCMLHPIELEIRAELAPGDIIRVREALTKAGFEAHRRTRRTMLMSFGQIGRIAEDNEMDGEFQETDIRCRVTDGQAEIVVKLGGVHSHDRREISTAVSPEALGTFARVVGSLNMFHKVGSRVTEHFARGAVSAAIVSSRSGLAYLELEKLSDDAHAERDRTELLMLAKQLNVSLLKDREAFMEFCTRLTEQDDWRFDGSPEAIERFITEALSIR